MIENQRLAEMGVMHPEQIDKFMVNSILNYDILRIIYRRKKGSLLPESRTYKFPRVQKTVSVGGDKSKTEVVMETDPVLKAAVSELKTLLKAKDQKQTVAEAILEEVELLEEDIAMRTESIKELVTQIKKI